MDVRVRVSLSAPTTQISNEAHRFTNGAAQVVELVDTLSSGGSVLRTCEFESRPGHHYFSSLSRKAFFFESKSPYFVAYIAKPQRYI